MLGMSDLGKIHFSAKIYFSVGEMLAKQNDQKKFNLAKMIYFFLFKAVFSCM